MIVGLLLGLATWPAVVLIVLAVLAATERTSWECMDCPWRTGWQATLPAWIRLQWHKRVTRPLGRCHRCHR